MTSSRSQQLWLIVLFAGSIANAWAGLGEDEGSIVGDRMRMRALHSVQRAQKYTVHELKSADGSRVRQYVTSTGKIFAVSWHTLYKPDLSSMLGSSFSVYSSAAEVAVKRGGIQRQLAHQGGDLVLQSTGHLNVYSGYAYRPSLLPVGLSVQDIGLG